MKFKEYIKHVPVFVLAGLLLCTSIFLSSCDDDDDKPSEVVLHSFGPAGVKHGETIKFIGLNLDKVSAIVLPGGVEITNSQFATQSATLIEIVIPEQAEAGKVVLKTPKGDIETKTMLNFEVPIVIESITGEARPGSNITIKGKHVNWIEEIVFAEELSVTEFVSQSLNELVVTVPTTAQTGFLIFRTGGTKPLTFASEEKLVVSLPKVTSLSPASVKHTDNLTITGTNLDLVTSIIFAGDKTVTEFVSKSENQIVVTVPAGTLKGKLLLKQTAPVDVLTDQELIITLPIGTALTPKPATPGVDNIKITGTNLDLVASLTLPGITAPIPASSFVSRTATEIVLALPSAAVAGGISYTTIHGYSNALGVNIALPGPGPQPLAIAMYDDQLHFNGTDQSWSTTLSDLNNTETAYAGSKSWKHTRTGGDGGVKAGGMTPIDASGQTDFVFSLYGGPGTSGKSVAAILIINGSDGWGDYQSVTITTEGVWKEYRIPLANYDLLDLTKVTGFVFKVESATSPTIFVDRVGFDGPPGPPPLAITLYDEDILLGGADQSWSTTLSNTTSTEEAYAGTKSWKHTRAGTDGGPKAGNMTPTDVTGQTEFVFSIFGGPGTAGRSVAAILITNGTDGWGAYQSVTITTEGVWTEYKIPLSNYSALDLTKVTGFILKVESATNPTIYVDRVGFK